MLAGADAIETLQELKLLQILQTRGLTLKGNSVSICRIRCDEKTERILTQIGQRRNSLLLLSSKPMEEREEGKRFRKKKILIRELVAAMCSDELFSVIDLQPERFEILTDEEAVRWMETIEKSKEETK